MTSSRLLHNQTTHRALTLIFLLTVTLTMSAQWTAQEEGGGGDETSQAELTHITLAPSQTSNRT